MPDIFHTFPINASAVKVYRGISTPEGLDSWWTEKSEGQAASGLIYKLYFGQDHNWKAVVTRCTTNREFELQMTDADSDWLATKVGFSLHAKESNVTEVNFYHVNWPKVNEHFKISCFCWAMYLRVLRRCIELGEYVPYKSRLDV